MRLARVLGARSGSQTVKSHLSHFRTVPHLTDQKKKKELFRNSLPRKPHGKQVLDAAMGVLLENPLP